MPDFSLPEDFDLSEHFDHRTLTRAMLLVPERALMSQRVEGPVLRTRLRGSTNQIYEQAISFVVDPRTGLHLRGHCSCPVGLNCKHVAAVLMAFEAHALRVSRQPTTGSELTVGQVRPEVPMGLPRMLEVWLGEFASAARPEPGSPTGSAPPTKRLMYVLHADGAKVQVQLHLGSIRRSGEVTSHRLHSPTVTDMMRTRPSYLTSADEVAFASLIPFSLNRWGPHMVLHGRTAAHTLKLLAQSGQCWFKPQAAVSLASPPGPAVQWVDEPLTVQLQWQADEEGHWRTQWEASSDMSEEGSAACAVTLLLLPEPHVFVPSQAVLRPARLLDAALPSGVVEWLTRMPAVPEQVLPQLVSRLQTAGLSSQVALPLPRHHAQPVAELGGLPLRPVLRLTTCPNLPSESWLEGHQRPLPAGQPVRQAALQLQFRYTLPGGSGQSGPPSVDFQFPAGASDIAFIEQPSRDRSGRPALTRFRRDAAAEAAAAQHLFGEMALRPWSRVAAWALDRLAGLKAGRLQAAALPPSLADGVMVLVPTSREAWPALLSQHIPALEAQGWQVERSDDFPFELFEADDMELRIDDDAEGGSDWFSVGLRVTVGGAPVELVPLLVGLVQAGWLSLEAALREPDGEVLLPWPEETEPRRGRAAGAPRERLLRLPVARIAPLVAWLRGVFTQAGAGGQPRVSRFELGALENLSAGVPTRAPPAMAQLLEQLRSLRTGQGLPPVAVSPHVQARLRPYQQDGLAWMDFLRRARFGGVLADDMGLGKTLQTLALLQNELDAGRLDRPSLVVVPTSLLGNWESEARRFTPRLNVLVLHGKQRAQLFKEVPDAHLVVTSYPLAVRDMARLAAQAWHYLVLDEAQRIKNSRSQAAMSLKGLRARHRLCLSGTPLENHLGELWSLMDFVSPGLLGSEAQFRTHYRLPIEKRQDLSQADQLARRVRPFILRRTKLQVASDLPEKTETLLRVELDGAQRDLYETVRASMDKKLRDAIAKQGFNRSQIVVLDALLKLRQVCCDPRLLKLPRGQDANSPPSARPPVGKPPTPSAKLELLLDLLPTLVEDGRRILIFSQFTEMLALIEPELDRLKVGYLKLTGESQDRAALVHTFQQGATPVFLISLKAGGVGLNLTAADTVILYDPWWNPAVEQQAIDRAYRIGQDKPVFVYKLVASGTVEDKMLELQARKAGLAESLLAGVASDAALNAEDFEELFKPLDAERAA